MNQTIQDFYEQASSRNFSRDFQLRITGFQVNGIDQIGEEDLVFLKTAQLPGKSISVQTTPFMGLSFNIPGSVTFDGSSSWAVTFYCTQDFNLRDLLERSMTDTFDQESSMGFMEPRQLDSYKIQLTLLDDQLNEIRTYELLGCFITNIGAISYNITGSGAIQEVTATLAYQYWTTGGLGVASGRGGIGGIANTLGSISSMASNVSRNLGKTSSVLKSISSLFKGFKR